MESLQTSRLSIFMGYKYTFSNTSIENVEEKAMM